ncbi:transglycosylase domain-containing protein [Capsulimonas corticalis]|nr:transglycosylase domain-containing protein [Capsulimonas corticalis]
MLGVTSILSFLVLMTFSQSSLALWLRENGLYPMLAIIALSLSWASILGSAQGQSASRAHNQLHLIVVATSLFTLCFFPQEDEGAALLRQNVGMTALPQWGVLVVLILGASSLASWRLSPEDNWILESQERQISIVIPNAFLGTARFVLLMMGLGAVTISVIFAAGGLIRFLLLLVLCATGCGVYRCLPGREKWRAATFLIDGNQDQIGRINLFAGAAGALYGLLGYCQAATVLTYNNTGARIWWFAFAAGTLAILAYSFVGMCERQHVAVDPQSLTSVKVRLRQRLEPVSLVAALPRINSLWRRPIAIFRWLRRKIHSGTLQSSQQQRRAFQVFVFRDVAIPHSTVQPLDGSAAKESSRTSRTDKTAILGRIAFGGALVWLCLKDWLTSNVRDYPYSSSLGVSLAVLAAVVAVRTVRRPAAWRDLLLAVATCSLIGLHAQAGLPAVAVLSLALPSLFTESDRLTSGSVSRLSYLPYALAALAGGAAIILDPAVEISGGAGWTSIALVACCLGAMLWSGRAFGQRITPPYWGTIAVFVLCGALYVFRTYLAAEAWNTDQSVREMLAGTGLRTSGGSPGSISSFIAQEGWIFWGILGLLLVDALCRSWDALMKASCDARLTAGADTRRPDQRLRANHDAQALAASAVTTLVALLAFGRIANNTSGVWVLALCIASLAISGVTSRQSSARAFRVLFPIPFRKPHLAIGAICVLAPVVWFCALWGIAWSMTGSGSPIGVAAFVPWSSMPGTLQNALPSGMPAAVSRQDEHDIFRQAFGSRIQMSPRMAVTIARRVVGGDRRRNPFTIISSTVLASMISTLIPEARIKELYLNDRDYGAPTGGLEQASQYYFHKRPEALSTSDALFLLGRQPLDTDSSPRFQRRWEASAYTSAEATQYQCQVFNPIPDMQFMIHDGGINQQGLVASYVVTHSNTRPYLWRNGRFEMLETLTREGNGAAVKVNDAGQAVGWSNPENGADHAALWDRNGAVRDLGTLPGFTNSRAEAINDKGQVVGYAFNSTAEADSPIENSSRAVLWEDGHMKDLGVLPNCVSSRAYAINDAGQIAGWVLTVDGRTHAMVWEDGVMNDIGVFGDGHVSVANAMNNAGQVVGSADHADGSVTAFLWENGVLHDLGALPGDVYSRALGVNDAGQVIGESRPDNQIAYPGGRPFLWDSAHGMRDLIPLLVVDPARQKKMAHSCLALSINNSGEVLGLNRESERGQCQFVLSPITAPASRSLSHPANPLKITPKSHSQKK